MSPAIAAIEALRRSAAYLLGSWPAASLRLAVMKARNPFVVLNFHRVAPPDGSGLPPVSPELFDRLLHFIGAHFSVTCLLDAEEPSVKPRLALSFDDGYRDFTEYAMPILAKHGMLANQNVIPACVEHGLPPLQVLVLDFLRQAPDELVQRLDIDGFDLRSPSRRATRLDAFLSGQPAARQAAIRSDLLVQFSAFQQFRPTAMMRLEDVVEASAYHAIGGHGFNHASMANETDEYLIEDVARCRQWIRSATGKDMRIYAFPNGSHRTGQPELVRAAGIDAVLLISGTLVHRDRVIDRIGVTGRSMNALRFRTLAAHAAIPRRLPNLHAN